MRVSVDEELLKISGVRKVPALPGIRRLQQMEIAFGPFERVVRLSVPYDRQGLTARLEDGFLVISVPKRSNAPRRIEVETE